jgi:hypothetical protein
MAAVALEEGAEGGSMMREVTLLKAVLDLTPWVLGVGLLVVVVVLSAVHRYRAAVTEELFRKKGHK